MKFAIIGLGRMGFNLTLNALESGVDVVGYNRSLGKIFKLQTQISKLKSQNQRSKRKTKKLGSFTPAYTVREVVNKLRGPRIILLMVQAGEPVDQVVDRLLASGLTKGDIVIDGGNSNYKDSIGRYKYLKKKGIHFLDMGTSGGIEGARNGACLMVGGDPEVYSRTKSLIKALACDKCYGYVGPSGAGHFVKVVHNGIEYGMLQAIGEGFEILSQGPYSLEFVEVSKIYSHGSVIRGWLMDLLHDYFKKDKKLERLTGVIGGGKTGRWAHQYAREEGVETPALDVALKVREQSQRKPTFAGKVIAALRNQFGGHSVETPVK